MKSICVLVPCALAGGITLDASTADACSLFNNEQFLPNPETNADDHTPPSAVAVEWRVIVSEAGGSCEARTTLEIDVSATDDRVTSAALGYLVRVVEGEVTNPRQFPEEPVRISLSGSLMYYFGAGEDISLKLEISAVDYNNNIGPPTLFEIEHESDSGGCSTTSPDGAFLAFFAPLALVQRRRRR